MHGRNDSTVLMGLPIARMRSDEVLDHIFDSLRRHQGGWLITANLDFLRRCDRDPLTRELFCRANLVVADGMPLVWASRLQGTPLPERVAGSALVWSIAERAAAEDRSLYLLGGAPGAAEGTAAAFLALFPTLRVSGVYAPSISNPPSAAELHDLREHLKEAQPDIILVGLGSPKQEQVIDGLRSSLPGSWMIGVGVSFSFVAGQLARAPQWMQRAGLEWTHRLAQDPFRLGKRYLIDDAPFALRLFWHSLHSRGPN